MITANKYPFIYTSLLSTLKKTYYLNKFFFPLPTQYAGTCLLPGHMPPRNTSYYCVHTPNCHVLQAPRLFCALERNICKRLSYASGQKLLPAEQFDQSTWTLEHTPTRRETFCAPSYAQQMAHYEQFHYGLKNSQQNSPPPCSNQTSNRTFRPF